MEPLELIISQSAQQDLIDIWNYIAVDNEQSADNMLDLLYEKCELLSKMPEIGTNRDELIQGLRSFPVKRFIVYYRKKSSSLEIVRILSSYRDIDAVFF